jgi:predicted lysophospholipase L1 biosynthesis ABC-type transport system permease subunit
MPKLLDLPFAPPWGSLAVLVLLFAATGAAVGLTATLRVYSARPAEVLRED